MKFIDIFVYLNNFALQKYLKSVKQLKYSFHVLFMYSTVSAVFSLNGNELYKWLI